MLNCCNKLCCMTGSLCTQFSWIFPPWDWNSSSYWSFNERIAEKFRHLRASNLGRFFMRTFLAHWDYYPTWNLLCLWSSLEKQRKKAAQPVRYAKGWALWRRLSLTIGLVLLFQLFLRISGRSLVRIVPEPAKCRKVPGIIRWLETKCIPKLPRVHRVSYYSLQEVTRFMDGSCTWNKNTRSNLEIDGAARAGHNLAFFFAYAFPF